MKIRTLTFEEITEIYNTHMQEAFPKDELRPFKNIADLYNLHHYMGLGGFVDDELKIYALYVTDSENKICLLDYFSSIKGNRSQGYGSTFLESAKVLLQDFDKILLEVESVESAHTEDEKSIRARRIGFYLRNGCKMSAVKSEVFGVEFNILYSCDGEINKEKISQEIQSVYEIMFTPKIMAEKVKIYC